MVGILLTIVLGEFMKGKIRDYENMGLVDGPGMRLVVFLSGCELRCLYCHNPETWDKNNFVSEVSSEDILAEYNKYASYYGTRGGVTFSGGEPLLQSEFVLETIKLFKSKGIHTAIDTSGVGENYDELLSLVDLVILDVKAVNPEEYKFITGAEIAKFEKFLNSCIEKNKTLWLRQVIVPGLNDDEEHVLKFKRFAENIPNVERIELLPYHSMAKSKYAELKIKYRLEDTPDMDKEKCKNLEKLLKN